MKILKSAKKIDLKIDNRIDTEICYRHYKLMYEQLQLLQTNKNCRQISNQHASEGFQVTCKFIYLSMRKLTSSEHRFLPYSCYIIQSDANSRGQLQ